MTEKSASELDVIVGANIRRLRKQNRESQTQLSTLIDCTFQQVQKYEKATNRVSAGKLKIIADHYGVSVDYLFQDPEKPVDEISNKRTAVQTASYKANERTLDAMLVLLTSTH